VLSLVVCASSFSALVSRFSPLVKRFSPLVSRFSALVRRLRQLLSTNDCSSHSTTNERSESN
jgi:hypothetical protein